MISVNKLFLLGIGIAIAALSFNSCTSNGQLFYLKDKIRFKFRKNLLVR